MDGSRTPGNVGLGSSHSKRHGGFWGPTIPVRRLSTRLKFVRNKEVVSVETLISNDRMQLSMRRQIRSGSLFFIEVHFLPRKKVSGQETLGRWGMAFSVRFSLRWCPVSKFCGVGLVHVRTLFTGDTGVH